MKIIILSMLVAATQAVPFFQLLEGDWEIFKMHFSKEYDHKKEDDYRMKIYLDNKHTIQKHNKQYTQGLVSFKMDINQFGDMRHDEFIRTMSGYRRSLSLSQVDDFEKGLFFMTPFNVTVPDTVDWRQNGAVTPVKTQSNCGSSWAYSSTGSLEGQNFRKTGKLVSLSEQNLIDCSRNYGNIGCKGGQIDNAFRYIMDNKGIDTESSYPSEGKDGICRYNPANSGAIVSAFVDLPQGDEEKLKIAVATVGPISVAIDASHQSIEFYQQGVYYEKNCSSQNLNHAVLIVGYGTENGQDYWLVKNSWGKIWGENGYIKMARNKNNNCGIASMASYPLV